MFGLCAVCGFVLQGALFCTIGSLAELYLGPLALGSLFGLELLIWGTCYVSLARGKRVEVAGCLSPEQLR